MEKTNVFKWLIIILSVHILSVQAGLLHGLSGKNEALWLAIIFALSYSAASGFIIYLSDKRWLIFIYAVADGIGVELYYEQSIPSLYIVIYFALYTFLLIYSTVLIDKTVKPVELTDEIKLICKYIDEGMTREAIAKKMDISPYRIWKLLKENNIKK